MSVGVFPLQPLMQQLFKVYGKGKVQKLFESLQCLRIQAARSDMRRLYSLDM